MDRSEEQDRPMGPVDFFQTALLVVGAVALAIGISTIVAIVFSLERVAS